MESEEYINYETPVGEVNSTIYDGSSGSPTGSNASLVVKDQNPGSGRTAAVVMGCLAAGLGLFALWKSKNSNTPPPGDVISWSEPGFTGTFYGGPNGLGLLTNLNLDTTSAELNSQHSVWVIRYNDESDVYVMNERMHMWRLPQPLEMTETADGRRKVHAVLLTQEETEAMIEKFSINNRAPQMADFVPVADCDLNFNEEAGYTQGSTWSGQLLFPIPCHCGANASHLISDGSNRSDCAWLLETATVSVTPIRKKFKHWLISGSTATDYCRISVDAPQLGSFSYCVSVRKANLIVERLRPHMVTLQAATIGNALATFGISLAFEPNAKAKGLWQRHAHQKLWRSSLNDSSWATLQSAIRFWSGKYGIFGEGRNALKYLVSGFEAQRQNAVCFLEGNWLNNTLDVVDVTTIFSTLMISPKPICTCENRNYAQVEHFCWCWLASTTEQGLSVAENSVSLPAYAGPFVFGVMLETLEDFLGRGVPIDLIRSGSLANALRLKIAKTVTSDIHQDLVDLSNLSSN